MVQSLPGFHRALSRRQALYLALGIFPAGRLLAGQETQQPSPTFSTDVKVVNVFATVRDKEGKIVKNLTKEDFSLSEDGRPQKIQYFSQQSDLPLTLGLLVDTSGSERRMIGTERDASYSFLEKVLRPASDKAFLIHFDREVELLQDLTSSRERLEKALALLNSPSWSNTSNSQGQGNGGGNPNGGWGGRGGGGGGYGRSHGGGGTAFYDAIYLAAGDLMKKQTGRKALIMLTDGEDNGSKISLPEAINSAQRADTLGYAVRIADDEQPFNRGGFGGPGMGRHGGGMGRPGGGGPYGRGPGGFERPDGKKILQQISRETGGAYFEVSRKKSVDQIYSEIEEDLRNQYSIGYTPDRAFAEGGYRRIQLTVREKKYVVQSREGYYVENSGKGS